eukprot:g4195.t1
MARRAGLRAGTGARARIAVIGAGVTGASFVDSCVARLGAVQAAAAADVHVFEMGRGPGGRCSTRNGARHGTPAFSVGKGDGGDRGDFAEAVKNYRARGLVSRWNSAKLGEIHAGNTSAQSAVVTTGAEFGLYRVEPNMCRELLRPASQHFSACVRRIARRVPAQPGRRTEGRWLLFGEEDELLGPEDGFDWIVVTSLAAANYERWQATFGGTPPLSDLQDALRRECSEPPDANLDVDIHDVTTADRVLARNVLDGMSETRVRPVLTSINMLSASSNSGRALAEDFPFDLLHVDGDPVIRKVVREEIDGGDTIAMLAHSTETFAEKVGSLRPSHSSVSTVSSLGPSSQAKQAAVTGEIEDALANVMKTWIPDFSQMLRRAINDEGSMQHKSLHRWGAAFPDPCAYFTDHETLDLSYVMPSMGLVVCGDFLGKGSTPGKVEAAVTSGCDAAKKITDYLTGECI